MQDVSESLVLVQLRFCNAAPSFLGVLSHINLAVPMLQAAGDEGGMSIYDPTGVLKMVGFVQYLDGSQLYKFAKALTRVTAKQGAEDLEMPERRFTACAPLQRRSESIIATPALDRKIFCSSDSIALRRQQQGHDDYRRCSDP